MPVVVEGRAGGGSWCELCVRHACVARACMRAHIIIF